MNSVKPTETDAPAGIKTVYGGSTREELIESYRLTRKFLKSFFPGENFNAFFCQLQKEIQDAT